MQYPDSQVNCLQITPDKQFIAAAGNPHIRLFEINNSNPGPPPVLSQVMVCLLSRDHGEVEVAARGRVLCHPR